MLQGEATPPAWFWDRQPLQGQSRCLSTALTGGIWGAGEALEKEVPPAGSTVASEGAAPWDFMALKQQDSFPGAGAPEGYRQGLGLLVTLFFVFLCLTF